IRDFHVTGVQTCALPICDILDPAQTEWTIDSPENAAALEYVRSFFEEGIADPSPDNESGSQVSRFVDGSTPMFISGPWDIPGLRSEDGRVGNEGRAPAAR